MEEVNMMGGAPDAVEGTKAARTGIAEPAPAAPIIEAAEALLLAAVAAAEVALQPSLSSVSMVVALTFFSPVLSAMLVVVSPCFPWDKVAKPTCRAFVKMEVLSLPV